MFQKRMIINTRERAVSTDLNRAQYFFGQTLGEQARALRGNLRGDFYQLPGWTFQDTDYTPSRGLRAQVLSGLEVIVDGPSSTNLGVNPGLLEAYVGAVGGDDAVTVVVPSAGLPTSTLGVLTFTANSGSAPRADIIECQVVDAIQESSSRDVFDASSGLFIPVALNKVSKPTLAFRLRVGTPGSQPAYDPAWLPLAVAIVQPGAVNFTAVDFYDVRPCAWELDQSRGGGGWNSQSLPWSVDSTQGYQYLPSWEELNLICYSTEPSTGVTETRGFVRGWCRGQLLGGLIRKNTPCAGLTVFGSSASNGGDSFGIHPQYAEEWIEGIVPMAASIASTVWLGLWLPGLGAAQYTFPRFVRYTESASVNVGGTLRRVPQGPRGLLSWTRTAPTLNAFSLQTLNNAGIAGALGAATGVPVAFSSVCVPPATVAGGAYELIPFRSNKGMCEIDYTYPLALSADTSKRVSIALSQTTGAHVISRPLHGWLAGVRKVRLLLQSVYVLHPGAVALYGTPLADTAEAFVQVWVSTVALSEDLTEATASPGKFLVATRSLHLDFFAPPANVTDYAGFAHDTVIDIDLAEGATFPWDNVPLYVNFYLNNSSLAPAMTWQTFAALGGDQTTVTLVGVEF